MKKYKINLNHKQNIKLINSGFCYRFIFENSIYQPAIDAFNIWFPVVTETCEDETSDNAIEIILKYCLRK